MKNHAGQLRPFLGEGGGGGFQVDCKYKKIMLQYTVFAHIKGKNINTKICLTLNKTFLTCFLGTKFAKNMKKKATAEKL